MASLTSTNSGSNPEFAAVAWTFGGEPGVVRGLLDFDYSVIPENAQINSASLSLYAYNSSGFGPHSSLSGNNSSIIKRITSSWDENSVNWNNQPQMTIEDAVILSESQSGYQDYLNIDITSIVQAEFNSENQGYGFLIQLLEESYYRNLNFCSSDFPNRMKRPEIEICYSYQGSSSDINEKNELGIQILMFPNPASNYIIVEIEKTDISDVRYRIFDVQGKTLKFDTMVLPNQRIDISNLTKGIYFIQFSDNQSKCTKELVVL